MVRVIKGSENGPQETSVEIQNVEVMFIITTNGERRIFKPAVVQNMMLEDDSEMSSVRDQCNRVENRSRGSKGQRYTIEGIITDNNVSEGNVSNLTVEDLKQLRRAENLEINSDLHSGPVVIRNFSIRQNNEIISIDIGRGLEKAFPFQMQIQEPEK